MGQQQLLLIVLGVIIVAVAVVAGIGMFNANAEEGVKDELVSHSTAIGAHAQQYFKKPVSMGGGGLDFTNYTIPPKMQVTTNCGTFATDGVTVATAGYTKATTATSVTITATPNSALGYTWKVTTVVDKDKIVSTIGAATGGGTGGGTGGN